MFPADRAWATSRFSLSKFFDEFAVTTPSTLQPVATKHHYSNVIRSRRWAFAVAAAAAAQTLFLEVRQFLSNPRH